MPEIVKVNTDNINREIIEKSQHRLILLDISADWCAPCRVLDPVLEKIAHEFKGKLILGKVEAEDENMKIAGQYNVRGFPTVIALYQGEELARFHGAKSFSFIKEFVEKNLSVIKTPA